MLGHEPEVGAVTDRLREMTAIANARFAEILAHPQPSQAAAVEQLRVLEGISAASSDAEGYGCNWSYYA